MYSTEFVHLNVYKWFLAPVVLLLISHLKPLVHEPFEHGFQCTHLYSRGTVCVVFCKVAVYFTPVKLISSVHYQNYDAMFLLKVLKFSKHSFEYYFNSQIPQPFRLQEAEGVFRFKIVT